MNKISFNKLLKFIFIKLPLIFLGASIILVVLFRFVPVYYTPLMAIRSIQNIGNKNFHTHKTWVSYKNISPELAKAVIASEDNRFCSHNGFDWKAIEEAKAYNEKHKAQNKMRGASTISQQTAKNVFLYPQRSMLRKGLEAYFTVLIELFWSKERIMEVYLNVIEIGPGIYGAEAASEQLFHTKAYNLTRRQACLIVACLPSPLKRNAAKPSTYVNKRAGQISRLIPLISYPDWLNHKTENEKTKKAKK